MIVAEKHVREKERIKELQSFSILDTLPESDYDDLTQIAAQICNTPISLITLVDYDRQWFKSAHGLNVSQTPRDIAFCSHAIIEHDDVFLVPDASKDERFFDNPLVINKPNIKFYAGVPLVSNAGLPIGTLCVIDKQAKALDENQKKSLKILAKQVMNLFYLRRTKLNLEQALNNLEEKNKDLERFASIAAHDLKSPLIGISGMIELFKSEYSHQIDQAGNDMLGLIENSSNKLSRLIDGILAYSKSENTLSDVKDIIGTTALKNDISSFFGQKENVSITLNTTLSTIKANKTAINQIIINLVANAIKYNDKTSVELEIGISDADSHYVFYVKDNGPGIAKKDQEKIFQLFTVVKQEDRYGMSGNGIGLATVKKLVEKCGGTIYVESEINEGSKFIFSIKK